MKRPALGSLLLVGCIFGGAACGERQVPESEAPPSRQAPAATIGRIRGVVQFDGVPPEAVFEPVTKDAHVCGTTVRTTRLALGTGNGVRHAFVYLENAPATGLSQARAAVTVDQSRCEYAPHAVAVPVGTHLDIANGDPILHNVHARQITEAGSETIFNIAQPMKGQRTLVQSALTKPGVVALTCEAGHPWMTGYILVADHPYTAVTRDDGTYEIADVPAGTYRLVLWHEGVRLKNVYRSVQQYEWEDPYEITREVVVAAGAEALANFTLKLR